MAEAMSSIVERMGLKTLVESCLVLEEGEASAKDIEVGMMMGAGILPGPFTRADDQGLDSVLEALERAQGEWGDGFEPPMVLRRLVAQGRLGKKSGQGFFPYPQPDDGQSRETIALETRGDVGIVWLNRPPANPLSPQVIRELTEVWEEIDGKLRVVVFASLERLHVLRGGRHQGVHQDVARQGGQGADRLGPRLHARDGAVADGRPLPR